MRKQSIFILTICTLIGTTTFFVFPRNIYAFKRIFLTADTSWTVVSDWSAVNTIEAIGAGGAGGDAVGGNGAGGGGGGGYAFISNLSGLTIGNSVTYQVGSTTPAVANGTNGLKGGDTFFNGSGATCANSSPSVCAQGGAGGSQEGAGLSNAAGGAASAGVPASCNGCFSGGQGGSAALFHWSRGRFCCCWPFS